MTRVYRTLTEAKRLTLQKVMALRPHTYAELAAIADVSQSTVEHHIRKLRRIGAVHVGGWLRTDGLPGRDRPMFSWGKADDVAPPPGRTAVERALASRRRRREAV